MQKIRQVDSDWQPERLRKIRKWSFIKAPDRLMECNREWTLLLGDVQGFHCWRCRSFTDVRIWCDTDRHPIQIYRMKPRLLLSSTTTTTNDYCNHILTGPRPLSDLHTTSVFLPNPINSDLEWKSKYNMWLPPLNMHYYLFPLLRIM